MSVEGVSSVNLATAVETTRTGDLWIFRGRSAADRAIQTLTNSPVNHVGMAVVLDDLPPLMWHAELGQSLPDMWTGRHQRGVQLHDLRDAVTHWGERYDQKCWFRQLQSPITREQEDELMRTIARLDGTAFPTTAKLAGRWFAGRLPAVSAKDDRRLETAYCAEVVALTYEAMGLLDPRESPTPLKPFDKVGLRPPRRRANWYDPGRFWSGDHLPLAEGVELGREIAVVLD
ncbi:hypothetical protein HQ308_01865 [Rhodococcus sp. BP-241]|uniref:hypothetical protein n=1 Tax=Rhodococcus sp. BP-241 TaxID=2739441 RepID=UPI001C9B2FD8|nr:hypothetical protein [Rhodococcus sp. BP-241]MBY6705543.1 hypothetical protein [Rhodococcus sp. BP-241]